MHGQPNVATDQTSSSVDDDEQLVDTGNGVDNEVESSSSVHIAMATGGTPLVYWRQESQEPVAQTLPDDDDDESYDDSDDDKVTCDVSANSDDIPRVTSGDISSLEHCVNKLSEVS